MIMVHPTANMQAISYLVSPPVSVIKQTRNRSRRNTPVAFIFALACASQSQVVLALDEGKRDESRCPLSCGLGTCATAPIETDENSTPFDRDAGRHFCICPDGWGGDLCESIKMPCLDSEVICWNGGKCTYTSPAQEEIDETFISDLPVRVTCDCDEPGVPAVGQFCQYLPTTTGSTVCDTSSLTAFCANNGRCRNGGISCECTQEFHGDSCELEKKPLGGQGEEGEVDVTSGWVYVSRDSIEKGAAEIQINSKHRIAVVVTVIVIATALAALMAVRNFETGRDFSYVDEDDVQNDLALVNTTIARPDTDKDMQVVDGRGLQGMKDSDMDII